MMFQPKRRQPDSLHRRRGAALLMVLWVVTIGAVLLGSMRLATQVALTIAYGEVESVQAYWLARAGVEQAIAVLSDDDDEVDSQENYWYSDTDSFESFELGDGHVFDVYGQPGANDPPDEPRYGLDDLSGRVNLNAANAKQLEKLDLLTDRQISAILDWRDSDNEARPGGAEMRHYQRLEFPYNIRNDKFQTMRELLLVRDVSFYDLTGEDVNTDGVLDENENDGEKTWPKDQSDGRLAKGLWHHTTIYSYTDNKKTPSGFDDRVNMATVEAENIPDRFNFSDELAKAVADRNWKSNNSTLTDLTKAKAPGGGKSKDGEPLKEISLQWVGDHLDEMSMTDDEVVLGRINVNTASREVLLTVPGLTDKAVDKILSYRESASGPANTVGDLLRHGALTDAQFKLAAEKLKVQSNVFSLTSRGRTRSGVTCVIHAVIDRGGNLPVIRYWHQSE